MPGIKLDLLDTSVWLPLLAADHPHHHRATDYWMSEAASQAAFCRVTAMSLLRLLTNKTVMAHQVLTPQAAWQRYGDLRALPEVVFLREPDGLEQVLARWLQAPGIVPAQWTDAYLAAFAAVGNCRLVAFDADFRRFPGVAFLHLSTR